MYYRRNLNIEMTSYNLTDRYNLLNFGIDYKRMLHLAHPHDSPTFEQPLLQGEKVQVQALYGFQSLNPELNHNDKFHLRPCPDRIEMNSAHNLGEYNQDSETNHQGLFAEA